MKNTVMVILFALISMMMLASGCTSNAANNTSGILVGDVELSGDVEKIEIYHFHGTNQCYSCVTVGNYAEETVNTYFADEVKSGKVVFGHINGELAENKDLVVKYGATGSSLWIGTYTKDGQFKAEQNTNVWYKINDKEGYMTYLKSVIDQKLGR